MNSLSLTLDLVGAIAIGYIVGFAFTKIKLSEKFEENNKALKELLNHKDSELMTLQKDLRDERHSRIEIEKKLSQLNDILNKKTVQYKLLKHSIKTLKGTIHDKKAEIKELETLLLEIQNDFEALNEELQKEKELNQKQKEEFKQKIEELTQKANDLYMVKGTEELKNAKAIFNKLREESLDKL